MRILFAVMLLVASCNGDGGIPDAWDGDGDNDAGDRGPVDGFRLVFEPGAQACGVFEDYRGWQKELELKGVVHFREGTVDLGTDQGSFGANLIDRVEFGPGREEPSSKGPGSFTYQFQDWGDPQNGCHHYEFRQPFDLGGQDLEIFLGVDFCLRDGVPHREEIRIGDDFSDEIYQLSGILGTGQDYQRYAPCAYRDLSLFVITAEVQGGDRAVVHKRHEIPMAGSGPGNIVFADVTVDGQQRVVDDYFSLVYAAEHHNWNETYVVLLDPPMGDVSGILLQEQNLWEAPTEMVYLGSDLAELRRRPLDSYNEVEEP